MKMKFQRVLKQVSVFFLLATTACQPSSSSLLKQADYEALQQRGQLARHLYIQVIESHKETDQTRFRALRSLGVLSIEQLHDYQTGIKAFERIIEEYSSHGALQKELKEVRFLSAEVAQKQLHDFDRAYSYIQAYEADGDLTLSQKQLLGRIQTSMGRFEGAEKNLLQAWDMALASNSCDDLKKIQLDLMQVNTLWKKCSETIRWGKMDLPAPCLPDTYSVKIELAHCYEYQGQVNLAEGIYIEMLKADPENSRVAFLLDSIRKRQKDQQRK